MSQKNRKGGRIIVLAMAIIIVGIFFIFESSGAEAAAGSTESHYRWRNDDGNEANATFAASEDTTYTDLPEDTVKRLRFGMTGDGSSNFSRSSAIATNFPEDYLTSGVIDEANGFAYFGTYTSPGQIIKIRLSDFTKVDTITLADYSTPAEYLLVSAVIDTENNFAYFGNFNSNGGQIYKIDIDPAHTFQKTATLNLGSSYLNLQTAFIDMSGATNYAYFVTYKNPSVILKINLTTFTLESNLPLTGYAFMGESVVDTSAGFAYLSSPSTQYIVKVNLATFSVASALATGVSGLSISAVIDTSGATHYAYFGTNYYDSQVLKINLDSFTLSATLTLTAGDGKLQSAVIDSAGGYAYFAGQKSSGGGSVIKIKLSDFTRESAITLNADEPYASSAVFDSSNGKIYLGIYSINPGKVVKVQTSDFTQVATLNLDKGAGYLQNGVIDAAGDFAYFISEDQRIVKVNLSDFSLPIDPVYFSEMANGGTQIKIDETRGFLYVVSEANPCKIAKVSLADLSVDSSVSLAAGMSFCRAVVFDETNGFLYLGNHGETAGAGKIVKVDVTDLSEDASISFAAQTNEYNFWSAVIDTTRGYAYFGTDHTNTTAGIVVKIKLSDFTRTSSLSLSSGEIRLQSAVIDETNGFAYFTTYPSSGSSKVVKVNIQDPTFSRVSSVTVADASYFRNGSSADLVNGYAYFTNYDFSGSSKILKVDVDPSNFQYIGYAETSSSEPRARSMIFDPLRGYVYSGLNTRPAKLVKFDVAPRQSLKLEYGFKESSCAAISSWTAVADSPTTEHWQMVNSSNITNGEATTNVASGITDPAGSFLASEIHDTTNQTSSITLDQGDFTEVEYAIKTTSNVTNNGNYCFRLTDAGTASGFTYTQYAEASLPNTAPGTPTLVSPADSNSTNRLNPTLTATFADATDSSDTGTINFRVATDTGFSSVVASGSSSAGIVNGANGTWTISPNLSVGTYYWQAQNQDNENATSSWSGYRTLIISSNASPNVPTLVSPANGSENGHTPTFTATFSDSTDSSDTGTINFQVDNNADFSSVTASGSSSAGIVNGANGTWTVGSALDAGTYYWRAQNQDDYSGLSDWSTGRTIIIAGPDVPEFVSPANGASLGTTPTLEVTYQSSVADLGQVNFQIATDTGFSTIVASNSSAATFSDGDTVSWVVAVPLSVGTYYWRAQSEDGSGEQSSWSAYRMFVVKSGKNMVVDYQGDYLYLTSDPQIQVSGSQIYYVWARVGNLVAGKSNLLADNFSGLDGTGNGTELNSSGTVATPQFKISGTKIYYVWQSGNNIYLSSSDLDGTDYAEAQITSTGQDSVPQFEISGSQIYYVWNRDNGVNAFPVTAVSDLDGGNFTATPRLDLGNTGHNTAPQMSISGSQIYYVFAKESDGIVTASSDLDGGNFSSANQSSDGTSTYPQIQAVGSDIYYTWLVSGDLYLGTDLSGSSFSFIKLTNGAGIGSSPQFKVSGNKVYYVYPYASAAVSDLDGGNFSTEALPVVYDPFTPLQMDFSNGTGYYVFGIDTYGDGYSFGAYLHFKSYDFSIIPPQLTSPADAVISTSAPASLSAIFYDVNADLYPTAGGKLTFQISSNSAFTSIVDSGSTSSDLANAATGTWTPTATLAGKTYYWRAKSTDNQANVSDWTSARTFTVISPPTGVQASAGEDKINLSWSASSSAVNYFIYRKTTGDYAYLTQTTSTRYADSAVDNGTTYYYKISSIGSDSTESAQSSEVSAVPYDVPTDLDLKINNGDKATTSRSVMLNIHANGASRMKISNNSKFTGDSWQTYGESNKWTLTSGYGKKTVYIKFISSSGGETRTVTDTIQYSAPGTVAIATSSAKTTSTGGQGGVNIGAGLPEINSEPPPNNQEENLNSQTKQNQPNINQFKEASQTFQKIIREIKDSVSSFWKKIF
jgi:hypothetical protein